MIMGSAPMVNVHRYITPLSAPFVVFVASSCGNTLYSMAVLFLDLSP